MGLTLAAEAILQACPSLLQVSIPGLPLKHGSTPAPGELTTTLPLCHGAQVTPGICCPWLGADPTVTCSLPKYELSGALWGWEPVPLTSTGSEGSKCALLFLLAKGAACSLFLFPPSPPSEETLKAKAARLLLLCHPCPFLLQQDLPGP